eukprot:3784559-Pyramimonas_sp.AAC.1
MVSLFMRAVNFASCPFDFILRASLANRVSLKHWFLHAVMSMSPQIRVSSHQGRNAGSNSWCCRSRI